MSSFRSEIRVLFAMAILVNACSSAPSDGTDLSSSSSAQTGSAAGPAASSGSASAAAAQTPPGPSTPPDPGSCTPNECGKNPYGMPNYTCPDGSTAGPVCERKNATTCGWEIRSCPPAPPPPPSCGPNACGPRPYGMPNYICPDGSTAGPVCDWQAGKCGWEIRSCPPAPPPPPSCGPNACGPRPYGMPNSICSDGSTAGPVCEQVNGICKWQIVGCP